MLDVKRWLRAAVVILISASAHAQVYDKGIELVQNPTFTGSAQGPDEVAASWRFWPEGTKSAKVAGTSLEITATVNPTVGVYQRIELNGASAPTIRVEVETNSLLDLPNFEPGSFHGGACAYAEFIMEDGRIFYGTYYPLYTATPVDSVIELQGPAGRISYMFLVLGVIRGMGMVKFANPSVKLFPSQSGVVTFQVDDGKLSTYTEVYPRLKQAGFVGSAALVSSWVGQPGFVTKSQVRELIRQGWDILSHSRTHPDLTALLAEKGREAVRYEFTQSARELEDITGLPIYGFVHPEGAQNGTTVAIGLEEYDWMRDFFSSINYSGFPPTMTHATKILASTSRQEMQAAVDAAKNGAWVLFVLHDVTTRPENEYDCTPEQLEMLITTVRSSGVKVLNCEDAAALFSSQPLPKQRGRRMVSDRSPIIRPMSGGRGVEWRVLQTDGRSSIGDRPDGRPIQN